MSAHKIGLLTTQGTKKHKEKISCKNLGQYRYCLINGMLNDLAPLQLCRCYITEILLHMHLKLVQPLGHILCIWIISYMQISTHFHLLCNYSQNYLLIRIPPTQKIPTTHFHSQQCSCLQWLYIWISQTQLTFLDTDEMDLITDMHTYKWV